MKLNKTLIANVAAGHILAVVLIGIVVLILIFGAWAASAYNSMVGVQEEATTALANVQSTYQRRADLIPNLVETVKGYAAHEKQDRKSVV